MGRMIAIVLLVCFCSRALSAKFGVFVDKQEASEFLQRGKRANSGFEEFAQGNFEQECVEEVCNYEETREVYEDDAVAQHKWKLLTQRCTYPSNPCSSVGAAECANGYNTYECHCHAGFTGNLCQTDVNECDEGEDQCPERSTCANTLGSYSCECDYGWSGTNCSVDVNECLQNICEHGICINEPGSFQCLCESGYTGDTCNEDVDECATFSNLCSNGGSCVNEIGSFSCSCPSGWTGSDCANDINECENGNPCTNGTCENDFGTFHCTCDAGYSGTLCDEDIDECALGYCPNGSECVDGVNQFTCVCPSEGCHGEVQQVESP